MKHFRNQIQDSQKSSSIQKKAGLRYSASKIKLNMKKDSIHGALMRLYQKVQKIFLSFCQQLLIKFIFA